MLSSGNFAIPSGSLDNAVPADGSITTAKLADDAITSAKIADDAVVAAAIADDAVTCCYCYKCCILATLRSDLRNLAVRLLLTRQTIQHDFVFSTTVTGNDGIWSLEI